MTLGMLQIFTYFGGWGGSASEIENLPHPCDNFLQSRLQTYYEILSIFSSFFIYWRQFSAEPFKHASSIRDHKK